MIRAMRSLEIIGVSGSPYGSEPFKAAEFWSRYGDGQLLPWQPGTVKEIEAAPAEHQLQAVMEKLQQLNPGFDGHEAHKIEGGVVTELEISSLKLSDISPLRIFKGLRRLNCHDSHVSDLGPLRGMALTELNFWNCDVSDLSPLAGMPLDNVHCADTSVSDLSPLKGMASGISRSRPQISPRASM